MWSQREIEINVSEPPWALRCYSRRATAHRVRWETHGWRSNTDARHGWRGRKESRFWEEWRIFLNAVLRATGENIDGKDTGEVRWNTTQLRSILHWQWVPTCFLSVCIWACSKHSICNPDLLFQHAFHGHKPGLRELKSHAVHRSSNPLCLTFSTRRSSFVFSLLVLSLSLHVYLCNCGSIYIAVRPSELVYSIIHHRGQIAEGVWVLW